MNLEVCDRPVFVVGAPRSGTSMMQWALRQHPELWGGQESDYLVPLLADLDDVYAHGTVRGKLHWLSGQQVGHEEFLRHIGYGINSLYMSRTEGRCWVEQTPQYTLYLDGIATMFPGASFLFMLRDGRQVVTSLRKFVNPVEHADACHLWVNFTRHGLAFAQSEQGQRMHTVRYEHVVENTEAALRDIYDFLGLPYAAGSVEFIRSRSPINSSFGQEVSMDKVRARWLDWPLEQRQIFREIAGELLVELGFEPDHSWIEAAPLPT